MKRGAVTKAPNAALRLLLAAIGIASMLLIAFVIYRRLQSPPILFEDVTLGSGIAYIGITHGVAWGDFDGDGLPDLYVTNHLNGARLYRNLGHGRFADVTDQWFSAKDLVGDKHGAAWADVDNDGHLDLVQLTGGERGVGSELKRLFMNRGNHFEEVGQVAGISNAPSRARTPLWFDLDRDGRLDLFEGAEERFDTLTPPFFFIQQNGSFQASDQIATFASRSVPFCIITELTTNRSPDLVCRVYGRDKASQVFNTAHLPLQELELLPATAFEDIAAGDFNNDGLIDLFLARKNQAPAVALSHPAVSQAIADVWLDRTNVDKPQGFRFRSSGQLTIRPNVTFPFNALSLFRVHVGSRDLRPSEGVFHLSKEDAGITGMAPFEPGSQSGLYLGLTPPDQWHVLVSGARDSLAGPHKYQELAVKIDSTEPITDLKADGDMPKAEEAPARLFINRAGRLVEEGDKWGVNARLVSGVSVVAGDFNNDMLLDLFVVVSGDVGKQENMLLLNRGDGHFDVIPGAGGAAGGPVGVGDTVTTVDFDGDGCLDLLVTTGGSMGRSLGPASETGSYHLYHNVCKNGNHWLEIDLEGTRSNRDGIGARVDLTAGGVTQVRIQDGGIHNRAQNHSRLHFGLAKNTAADKITVRWPSGTKQELSGMLADQILRIKEP
jgi:ASPIC and UnbV/FG-GAP-like repeat